VYKHHTLEGPTQSPCNGVEKVLLRRGAFEHLVEGAEKTPRKRTWKGLIKKEGGRRCWDAKTGGGELMEKGINYEMLCIQRISRVRVFLDIHGLAQKSTAIEKRTGCLV